MPQLIWAYNKMLLWFISLLLRILNTRELQLAVIGILEKLAAATESPVDDLLVAHFKKAVLEGKDAGREEKEPQLLHEVPEGSHERS